MIAPDSIQEWVPQEITQQPMHPIKASGIRREGIRPTAHIPAILGKAPLHRPLNKGWLQQDRNKIIRKEVR
jgi:hypothetical protein